MRVGAALLASLIVGAPLAAQTTIQKVERRIADARASIMSNPGAAVAEADQLIRESRLNRDVRTRATLLSGAHRLKAEVALRIDRPQEAEQQANQSLRVLERLGDPAGLTGDALLTRGGAYSFQGKVAAALADYQAAFEVFRKRSDRRNQAVALLYIANLYADAQDIKSSIRYLDQASELDTGDAQLTLSIVNNRANVLNELHRYQQADAAYTVALRTANQLADRATAARILGNMARNRIHAGAVDAAETMVKRALGISQALGDDVTRARLLAISAEIALRRNRTGEAGRLIERSFAGVDLHTTTMTSRDAHDTAYRTFVKLGRSVEALAHLEALKRLDDEATKLATTTSTALMGARFDFANQELRIAKLRAEELRRSVEVEQAKARFERTIFAVVAAATAAVIALLGWLLFTIRRSRDRIRIARDDLAVTNAALGKALAAKTEFLATTSHEIRTPLNGILGMTQVMLADRALAPDLRERLGVVHTAGTTMRALVDDILDVAKMESGNLTVEETPFDLRETLRAATLLWEVQCRSKGLSFRADIDASPTAIVGDAARVRQVIFNLLANAVKFTGEGGVMLVVATDRAAETIAISVADTGIGIAPDQQATIFDAFRQADASTTRRFGGTGLGLSISRNLAEAMGGRIDVTSAPGDGATFTLTLPWREVAAIIGAPSSADVADLLVVEQSPIARAMWRSLLAPRELAFAATVGEAMAMIERGCFNAVLVDDVTIRGDLDLVADVAATAHGAGARFIQLWPAGRDGEHDAVIAAGSDIVVARPFVRSTLLAAIAKTSILAPLVSDAA